MMAFSLCVTIVGYNCTAAKLNRLLKKMLIGARTLTYSVGYSSAIIAVGITVNPNDPVACKAVYRDYHENNER